MSMTACAHRLKDLSDKLKHELQNAQLIVSNRMDDVSDKYYKISEWKRLRLFLTNGCKFSDGACYRSVEIPNDDYTLIHFVYGASGNSECEGFDYCEYNNGIDIIIFMDYFRDLVKQNPDEILGYSKYLDEIVRIADLIVCWYKNPMIIDRYPGTAAAMTWKLMPFITAVNTTKDLIPLTDNDMSGVKISDITEWLSKHSLIEVLQGDRD